MKAAIINLATLISVIMSLWYSRAHPRVLVYAFILVLFTKIILVQILLAANRKSSSESIHAMIHQIIQTPSPGPPPQGMYDVNTGKEVGFGWHILVLAGLTLFAFMLSHVNADKQLDFYFPVFLYEIKWALWVFFIYELKDLIWKGIIIDFSLPAEKKFAYNASPIGILAVAVLLGALLTAIIQGAGMNPSAWVILGPLLALKHIPELLQETSGNRK